jgi:hypothetical protein
VYLMYQPEGSDEPTRWKYNPRKLMSAEREAIEKHTDRPFAEFTQDVMKGSSVCRRALLWVMLKREHPTTKYGDVDFAWDELRLEFSNAAHLLGVRPDDWERFTVEETDHLLDWLDAYAKDIEKQEAELKG